MPGGYQDIGRHWDDEEIVKSARLQESLNPAPLELRLTSSLEHSADLSRISSFLAPQFASLAANLAASHVEVSLHHDALHARMRRLADIIPIPRSSFGDLSEVDMQCADTSRSHAHVTPHQVGLLPEPWPNEPLHFDASPRPSSAFLAMARAGARADVTPHPSNTCVSGASGSMAWVDFFGTSDGIARTVAPAEKPRTASASSQHALYSTSWPRTPRQQVDSSGKATGSRPRGDASPSLQRRVESPRGQGKPCGPVCLCTGKPRGFSFGRATRETYQKVFLNRNFVARAADSPGPGRYSPPSEFGRPCHVHA